VLALELNHIAETKTDFGLHSKGNQKFSVVSEYEKFQILPCFFKKILNKCFSPFLKVSGTLIGLEQTN